METGTAEIVSLCVHDATSSLREMSICMCSLGICLGTEDNLESDECHLLE